MDERYDASSLASTENVRLPVRCPLTTAFALQLSMQPNSGTAIIRSRFVLLSKLPSPPFR
ncbi:hypothetical protein PAXRUDRAFT_822425 [Paxillus rubicundulus Ve08.2h10]|uniref:Unplaced genomic scaffold scaffold_29, whole genome shotgun sequence n=1 Tax=Paxillus rubicundulus Ve08.2h10 TaxID=930991 RepID=A0A0D0DM28_9AGAM|nr:hypothetical protein PAXRUDRAFT_822425 [Paxillus rubicundulus Ve08.2h10]